MPLNVTAVFIQKACDALKYASLTKKQEEKLCDELVKLCHKYAPGTFETHGDEQQ